MIKKVKSKIYRFINIILGLCIKPRILDIDKTLNLLADGNSIARFGDGEFYLATGQDIYFQPAYPELQTKLKAILNSNVRGLLVGIPSTLVSTDSLKPKPAAYWQNYYNEKRFFIYRLLTLDKTYADALVTRLYIDYKDKKKSMAWFAKLKKVWNGRHIVIIEGEKSRLGVGNDFFEGALSIRRVIGPSKDAYIKLEEIKSFITENVSIDRQILIALGPAATVLAFELHLLGYQAIDLGHADIEYEWMLMGAEEKVPVKNKNMWEVKGGEVMNNDLDHSEYIKSIINKIL